jgi:hypothetical protein
MIPQVPGYVPAPYTFYNQPVSYERRDSSLSLISKVALVALSVINFLVFCATGSYLFLLFAVAPVLVLSEDSIFEEPRRYRVHHHPAPPPWLQFPPPPHYMPPFPNAPVYYQQPVYHPNPNFMQNPNFMNVREQVGPQGIPRSAPAEAVAQPGVPPSFGFNATSPDRVPVNDHRND